MIVLFFWLLVGHCLADYPLQGEFLATAKRRTSTGSTPWQIALWAHSMIHAGFVAGLTGSISLGLCEFAAHWLIDYAKCEGWLRPQGIWFQSIPTREVLPKQERQAFWIDQALHVLCKIVWIILL